MPQRRRERVRTGVSEAELLELELGPATGAPSLFATPADREAAELAYARQRADWDALDVWEADGSVLAEIGRRHARDGHPTSSFGPCPRCPDRTWSWS